MEKTLRFFEKYIIPAAFYRLGQPIYHYIFSFLANFFYKSPSKKIFVLGITGTKGKSTVVELINAILEAAGRKTALISSARIKINNESRINMRGLTMPGRFTLQKILRKAVDEDCDFAILEVSSQGVLQHRHRFIDFDAALITNLYPEHIEAHGSFENYRNCKVGFFKYVVNHSEKPEKFFFINTGARDYRYFYRAVEGRGNIVFYNQKDSKKIKVKDKIFGEFNAENIAAAIAFARSQNIEWDIIKNAIEDFKGVPGRFEFIQKIPFSVIIDYAHTPDSLEKVYQTIQNLIKSRRDSGKMICVLGSCGGGRDIWKRPIMGKIAGKYCDGIILTNEDPFDDNPKEIVDQIADGVEYYAPEKKYKIIIDRRDAIDVAIDMARKGDTIIITGKGSEFFMRLGGGKKIPWNEKEIVLKILNEKSIQI